MTVDLVIVFVMCFGVACFSFLVYSIVRECGLVDRYDE